MLKSISFFIAKSFSLSFNCCKSRFFAILSVGDILNLNWLVNSSKRIKIRIILINKNNFCLELIYFINIITYESKVWNNKIKNEYWKVFNLFNDQKLINDKLRVLNKFIFDSTVKNQLKLQISNKDPIRMNEINGDVLTNLKSILTVVLDQLNEI